MTTATPPTAIEVRPEGLPSDLTEGCQHVAWKWETRDGKPTKVPYNVKTGSKAASDDPQTWASFTDVIAAYSKGGYDGAGRMFADGDALTGIDFDKCRDPETETIDPVAASDVRRLNSYTEISPSGTGLRVYVRGNIPRGRNWRNIHTEVYGGESNRYLTLTGYHLAGTPTTVEDRQVVLDQLYAEWDERDKLAKPLKPKESANSLIFRAETDDDLIRRMMHAKNGERIRKLWDGKWADDYPSQSEADAALCEHLAFYTDANAARIDKIFRRSGLNRDKWERKDYRDGTIKYAIDRYKENADGEQRNGAQPSDTSSTPKPKAAQTSHRFKPTDLGNAERLVARHGRNLRYVPTWGWMIYDGVRWVRDEEGIIVARLAAETVRSIYHEAAQEEDADKRAALSKHAAASERAPRIAAMVALARSVEGVIGATGAFDADPYRLACLNGTLDLRTGQLGQHRREDLITKVAPVEYDPEAIAPQWQAFLRRIFAGDQEIIDYVQRAAGYALTGDTSERALFVLHGSGANGKSTLLEALRAVLGDYALRTPAETLLAKREGGIPNDVARLRGARLVTASETEDGRRFAEAFIKDLTGGDTLAARFMRAEWFDFKPVCKVWLATNHKPEVRGTDNAIWDRIRLIPFSVAIPKAERDRHLAAKLRDELPGILTWAIEGCWSWIHDGLREPASVRAATDEYRADQDVLGAFVNDRCVTTSDAVVAAAELYKAYTAWCEAAGEKPLTQRTFGMRLAERGYQRKRGTGGVWQWHGIGLLANPKSGE